MREREPGIIIHQIGDVGVLDYLLARIRHFVVVEGHIGFLGGAVASEPVQRLGEPVSGHMPADFGLVPLAVIALFAVLVTG